jgi:hypothetical protein
MRSRRQCELLIDPFLACSMIPNLSDATCQFVNHLLRRAERRVRQELRRAYLIANRVGFSRIRGWKLTRLALRGRSHPNADHQRDKNVTNSPRGGLPRMDSHHRYHFAARDKTRRIIAWLTNDPEKRGSDDSTTEPEFVRY